MLKNVVAGERTRWNFTTIVYKQFVHYFSISYNSVIKLWDIISTMKILYTPFTILRYFGIWAPTTWTSRRKEKLYILYSALVLFTMYTFVGSQLIEVLVYFFRYGGISESLYLFLTTSSACYKALAFLRRRKEIISLSDMLISDHCILRDVEEKKIQNKADKINRYTTWICVVLVYNDILLMLIAPLFQMSDKRMLPYKTWLPFSIQNASNYSLSYLHQTFGLICCGSVSLAVDNIVTGFMLQVGTQFDILEHRFNTLPERILDIRSQMSSKEANHVEKIMLIELFQHHDYLYLYAKNIMSTFGSVVLVQFCASAMVIIVSIYQLTMTNIENFDFFKVLVYLMSMFAEFFIYCWFGNEVHLKSIQFVENVYKSNWNILNLQSWKMILLMMKRSSKPIIISCYNVVFLSLGTYVQILKFSYSSYSVLRKAKLH